MKNPLLLLLAAVLLAGSCRQQESATVIDLSGSWRFAADPGDKGVAEKWYLKNPGETVTLPGSVASNGKGEEISLHTKWTGQILDSSFFLSPVYAPYREPGNFKIPFWLQPVKHYVGAAWYQKQVVVPPAWKSRTIVLVLERCHWESRLWIDDREAGMRNSLGTPHRYDLTGILSPGKHTLTLCVDNRIKEIDPGMNAHSISDHTQTNWNGIAGKIYLESRPLLSIRSIRIFPDYLKNEATARVTISNLGGETADAELTIAASGPTHPGPVTTQVTISPGEKTIDVTYPMGAGVKLWSEFHPDLYQFTAILANRVSGTADTSRITFGMREIKVDNGQILLNGHPLFLRGTLECAIFPKTGYPSTAEEEWLRIFQICRAHGLNHMRFHSWCPPEAAFSAADKTGFYLQVECSAWANQSTSLGDGKPFDTYLYEESERMVEAYGNHPSFCMMAYGNEPRGKNQDKFLTEFITHWKVQDNRRLYLSGAGWPNLEVNDYLSMPEPRIQQMREGVNSLINSTPPSTDYDWSSRIEGITQPVISHEIGQWCVYPDFKEIAQYDGVLRARNFEIFRESLERNGMAHLADSFLLASGKLQALCYKADIEAALRTPRFGGFQLLDLHDFPGQGTALVGVLNAFWNEKGYISPEEFRRFCNSTVPLVRMKKMVFLNDETFGAEAEVAHFGEAQMENCIPRWKITGSQGTAILEGELPAASIEPGRNTRLGKITFSLSRFKNPQKLTLELQVEKYVNSWDFWVYPARQEPIEGKEQIRIVQVPDEETLRFLSEGGVVLLNLKKGSLADGAGGEVKTGFSSIFWNTAWTRGQAPHTLGILCDPGHPALALFPSEYHTNWQWQDAMSHAGTILLSSFTGEAKPIVRVIDDWFTNRPLALIFEARVGKGRLLVSGVDLETGTESRPEARQLLFSLQNYMRGPHFNPSAEITPEQVARLIR